MSPRNAVLLALVAVVAASAGYWTYSSYQKRAQHKAIAARVSDGTAQLRASLAGDPAAEQMQKLDAALAGLRATPVSRQVAFAGAAESYLVGARAIMLRRADVVRLTPLAEERNKELASHMSGPRGRDEGWIRRATELKKQSDQVHYELALAARTLGDLLEALPEVERGLEPYVGKSLALDEALRQSALQQARDDARRATDALAVQLQTIFPR